MSRFVWGGFDYWDDYEERNYEPAQPAAQPIPPMSMDTRIKHLVPKPIYTELVQLKKLPWNERKLVKHSAFSKGVVRVNHVDQLLPYRYVGLDNRHSGDSNFHSPGYTSDPIRTGRRDDDWGRDGAIEWMALVVEFPVTYPRRPDADHAIIWRYVPRPFTFLQALTYGEIDKQTGLFIADHLMERGYEFAAQMVQHIHKQSQPRY